MSWRLGEKVQSRPQKCPSVPIIPGMAGTLPIAQAHPDSDAYLNQNPAILVELFTFHLKLNSAKDGLT